MEHLTLAREGPAAIVTLNRPRRRNALSLALMSDLIACFDGLSRDASVRAFILAAAGEMFCAGQDLSELVGLDVNACRHTFDVATALMDKIQSIPQPVIAQVHGLATAGGLQLVATCDMVVASEDARFAAPGVRIGLFCTTPMVPLTRAIGRKRAFEMLVTGDAIDARTAAEWGLVNHVVPAAELAAATRGLAARIAETTPLVMTLGKQAFYTQIDLDQSKAYAYAKEIMTMNAMAPDAQEGIGAFLAKRAPSWKGK